MTISDIAAQSILDLVSAFLAGDAERAGKHLAPSFGIHDGRDRDNWIAFEIAEYAGRCEAFGLRTPGLVWLHHPQPDLRSFAIVTEAGRLVFEDELTVDGNGMISGNQRPFEIVTKVLFEAGRPPRRAMAVRSLRAPVISVVPLDLPVDDLCLVDALGQDRDDFRTVEMLLRNDDLLCRHARFRLRDSAGQSATVRVRLRGKDDPFFVDGLYPVIEGSSVIIPPNPMTLWALSVELDDGHRFVLEHPLAGRHSFQGPVVTAIVTDALDNDWKTSRRPVR